MSYVEATLKVTSTACWLYLRGAFFTAVFANACGAGPMASQSITGILAKAHREQGLAIPFQRRQYDEMES